MPILPLVLQFYLWKGTLGRVGFFPAADGAGSALASLFCAGAGSLYLLPSGIIGLLAHKDIPDINEHIISCQIESCYFRVCLCLYIF